MIRIVLPLLVFVAVVVYRRRLAEGVLRLWNRLRGRSPDDEGDDDPTTF